MPTARWSGREQDRMLHLGGLENAVGAAPVAARIVTNAVDISAGWTTRRHWPAALHLCNSPPIPSRAISRLFSAKPVRRGALIEATACRASYGCAWPKPVPHRLSHPRRRGDRAHSTCCYWAPACCCRGVRGHQRHAGSPRVATDSLMNSGACEPYRRKQHPSIVPSRYRRGVARVTSNDIDRLPWVSEVSRPRDRERIAAERAATGLSMSVAL